MKKLLPLLLLPLLLCAEGLTDSFSPELSNKTKELTEIKPKKNSFYYVTTGLSCLTNKDDTYLCPFVGFGVRSKKQHLGYDLSVNTFMSIETAKTYSLPEISAKAQGLYHFSKNPSSYYTGVSAEGILAGIDLIIIPEVVLGKEWDKGSNKANFCYVGINPLPTIVEKSMPLIALNYGWGF